VSGSLPNHLGVTAVLESKRPAGALTTAEPKAGVALTFGVGPEAIEIPCEGSGCFNENKGAERLWPFKKINTTSLGALLSPSL
jgi:hypothetical protein